MESVDFAHEDRVPIRHAQLGFVKLIFFLAYLRFCNPCNRKLNLAKVMRHRDGISME